MSHFPLYHFGPKEVGCRILDVAYKMSDVESQISDVGRNTAYISFRIRDTTVPTKYVLQSVSLVYILGRFNCFLTDTD